jgi:hypothetical protein
MSDLNAKECVSFDYIADNQSTLTLIKKTYPR